MNYANPQYLTNTHDLAKEIELDTGRLRIFDVTISLKPNPPGYKAVSGRSDYLDAHIPGAAFLDLIGDLSDSSSKLGFTRLPEQQFEAALRSAGVCDDSQVVLYSSDHMMWATRAWWMLYASGHKNVSVLDGGFRKWQEERRAVSSEDHHYAAGDVSVVTNDDRWVDKNAVFDAINVEEVCTINALSPDVYSGVADMHYGRKGHITNSKNIYYADLLEAGCFRSADELTLEFTDRQVLDMPRVISYCGGGISATIDALALALIGYTNVAVYDGSMSEWVRDENLPLVLGENPAGES